MTAPLCLFCLEKKVKDIPDFFGWPAFSWSGAPGGAVVSYRTEQQANTAHQWSRWETIEYIRIQQESRCVIPHTNNVRCGACTLVSLASPTLNVEDSKVEKKSRQKNAIACR